MLRALTHKVSPDIASCELTYLLRAPIDVELASQQHQAYEAALTRLGVTVKSLSLNEKYPDACFVEDTAVVVDELAVICSMGVASRRGETQLIAEELSAFRELVHISKPATIEGGDVLRIGKQVLVGESGRTNRLGIEALGRILGPLGYKVIPVPTRASLHFKSGCTAIDDETLFLNPDWVETECLKGFDLIFTPNDEPASANVLRIGEIVCLQADFPKSIELIQRRAGRLEVMDMSELRKAEAGLTCSSIIFANR